MARGVENVMDYWLEAPPEPSGRLLQWLERIRNGWRPNRRISGMGYYEASEFYGVYIWEYLNVLRPALRGESSGAAGQG